MILKHIKALRQKRADLHAEAQLALTAAAADGRGLTDTEKQRDDAIQAELLAIADELTRYERAAQAMPALPPTEPTGPAASSGQGFPTFGEFLQAVAFAGMPGRSADPRLFAASGASSGVPSDGGFLVRTDWSLALLEKAMIAAVLAPKCKRIQIGAGSDGLEAPYVDESSRATGSRWGGVQVYRAAEAAAVTATKPKLGKFELRLEDLKGLFYATDRLLRDAVALEAIAMSAFPDEFAFKLDDEILRGTGAGQCQGILNAGALVTVAKESGQAADTIVAENVMKMHSRLLARNMGGAIWYINQEILPQLYTMAVAIGVGGVPVYMPANGLSSAPFGTLFGRPVQPLEQASGLGDLGDIVLADLGEYLLIDKPMTSASSMHVRFIYDEMTFRWTWPVNGRPIPATATTPYKATSATSLSPFVTLAAR